jgi:uncharacterized protein YbbK (DUF523 family)
MAPSTSCSSGWTKGGWWRCARRWPAACRRRGGQGALVLDGQLPVLTVEGADVTAAFVSGAEQALALVREHGIRLALLKARSPSCGNLENYDGSFSGVRVPGEGVTAALLRRAGVKVFNEAQLDEAAAELARLEAGR